MGQGLMVLNRGQIQTRYKEEIFYDEGGETLEQVAQGSCGCPVIGSVWDQVGRGFEQSDLVKESLPMVGWGWGLDWIVFEGSIQPKSFYGSMILYTTQIYTNIQ